MEINYPLELFIREDSHIKLAIDYGDKSGSDSIGGKFSTAMWLYRKRRCGWGVKYVGS